MPKKPYAGEKPIKQAVVQTAPTDKINREVKIQSLIDAHLLYDGKVSKRHYEWTSAGAIVSVDENDVPELLSKRLGGNTCCGGNRDGNQIFQLA